MCAKTANKPHTDRSVLLPQDLIRAAYLDRIVVLNGYEGNGAYHTANRTIENLRKYAGHFSSFADLSNPHSPLSAPQKFLIYTT